ncbi:MAG: hypothetical protein GY845_21260 [Planctomycetes bacterium]|nr:hypothetical protein [Planctomycetota bacterium]
MIPDYIYYGQCERILSKCAGLKRKTMIAREKNNSKIIETEVVGYLRGMLRFVAVLGRLKGDYQ